MTSFQYYVNSGKDGQHCLFPKESLYLLPEYVIAFIIKMLFILWRYDYVYNYLIILHEFYQMPFLQNEPCGFLLFLLLMQHITLFHLYMLNHSCMPGTSSN